MKSAFECFQRAAQCEERAKAARDEKDRLAFLSAAQHWQTLGKLAEAREAKAPADDPATGSKRA